MNQKEANYGNWVPEKMLKALLVIMIALLLITAVFISRGMTAAECISGVLCIAVAVFLIYMYVCHELFAFGKGNMMAKVHEHLVEHLGWDGQGTLLDIGCGGAALTVRCAKAYPHAQITAMDYWGAE